MCEGYVEGSGDGIQGGWEDRLHEDGNECYRTRVVDDFFGTGMMVVVLTA